MAANQLSERELQEMREAFEEFDADGNGTIDGVELKAALEKAGLMPSLAELDAFMTEADTNNDGVLDFDEFCAAYSMIDSDAFASEVGGIVKLRKMRVADKGKDPRNKTTWARAASSTPEGRYKKSGGQGTPNAKRLSQLP